MAFVNRLIELSGSVAASTTADDVESFRVRSSATITTVGFYVEQNSDIDITLKINETTVVDDIPADNLPPEEDPLRYEVRLEEGDEIQLIADNGNTGSAQTARVVFLVEDTQESMPTTGG